MSYRQRRNRKDQEEEQEQLHDGIATVVMRKMNCKRKGLLDSVVVLPLLLFVDGWDLDDYCQNEQVDAE